jgi:hypothetical protein
MYKILGMVSHNYFSRDMIRTSYRCEKAQISVSFLVLSCIQKMRIKEMVNFTIKIRKMIPTDLYWNSKSTTTEMGKIPNNASIEITQRKFLSESCQL